MFMSKRKLVKEHYCVSPDITSLRHFTDIYSAFYWLGYFAGTPRKNDVPNIGITEDAGSGRVNKMPLCETAHFCVFDTETSGLSVRDCAVQVALGFFDRDGCALGFYNRLWKLPHGVRVSSGSYDIHKISTRKIEEEGYDAACEVNKILKIIRRMLERGKKVVAHNAAFDCRILAQTARNHGVGGWDIDKNQVFCTMAKGKAWCNLRSKKTGRAKAPTNAELYKILKGSWPKGALHDALVDIKVTAQSYVEGKKRGWW